MYTIINDKSPFHAGDVRVAPNSSTSVAITRYYLVNGQLESEAIGEIEKTEVEALKEEKSSAYGSCLWLYLMDMVQEIIKLKLGYDHDFDITDNASIMFDMY